MGLAQKQPTTSAQLTLTELAQYVPLSSLDIERLQELNRSLTIKQLRAGERVFTRDDNDEHVIYLHNGSVELDKSVLPENQLIRANSHDWPPLLTDSILPPGVW